MDGSKKVLAILALMAIVIVCTAPALSQSYGGRQQAGQARQGGTQQPTLSLLATAQNMTDISIFLAAVKATGYDTMLDQNQGPIMVLAPTDKALARDMGIKNASALTGNAAAAKSLVENCIVPKLVEPSRGATSITLTTISGKQIIAKKSASGITVNGITAGNATMATNGILVVTDGVAAR